MLHVRTETNCGAVDCADDMALPGTGHVGR